MKIVVLVKQVPDTYGERRLDDAGRLDRTDADLVPDEIGERALELALTQKDEHDAEVVLMTMGPPEASDTLRKGLAIGADAAVHIVDDALAGSDLLRTSAVLAAALRAEGFDAIVAGNESTDGRGGALPAMVAERLGIPHATFLNSVAFLDGRVTGERAGEAATRTVGAPLPAVVSVTERTPEARFPTFKGTLRAKKKPLRRVALDELDPPPVASGSVVVSVAERPARAAGVTIVDEGGAARELVAFLHSSNLV